REAGDEQPADVGRGAGDADGEARDGDDSVVRAEHPGAQLVDAVRAARAVVGVVASRRGGRGGNGGRGRGRRAGGGALGSRGGGGARRQVGEAHGLILVSGLSPSKEGEATLTCVNG